MNKHCTLTEVASFERGAEPGTTLVYFTADSSEQWHGLAGALRYRNPGRVLITVVNVVRRMTNDGVIDLVQARRGGVIEYRAIWSRFPLAASELPHPFPMVGDAR